MQLLQKMINDGITRVGDICTVDTGKKDVNAESLDGIYPFFTCSQGIHKINTYTFDDEAVLIAGNGFFNVKYYKGKFDAYQRTYVLHGFKNNVKGKYLYYFVAHKLDEITKDNRGSTIRYIRLGDITEQQISLPTLDYQENAIKLLDNVLDEIKLGKEKIQRSKQFLNKFRQAILAAAITGKLTNTDYKTKEFSDTISIPIKWKVTTLKQVVNSLSTGPFGSTLHQHDYVSNGIPVINPVNIIGQSIVSSPKATVTQEKKVILSSYVLRKNDIVIARRGEMGRCAVITEKEDGWLCGTGCFIIRPSENIIDSEYLSTIISSSYGVNYLSNNSVGTTMKNLNLNILGNMLIPLPELSEQKEILKKIKHYSKVSSQIEEQTNNAEAKVSKLTQAILAKTFQAGDLLSDQLAVH